MTEQKIYFQWQNEVLAKTIYPLREMKLRHVLEYYMEIDVWREYKDKKIENLSSEVTAYHAKRKEVITNAVKDYANLLDYFLKADPEAVYVNKFKAVEDGMIAKVKALHDLFKTYYPKITDPRREAYFISQRVIAWEQEHKNLTLLIAQKLRRINVIKIGNPNHPNIPKETAELQKLQNLALPIANDEMDRLRELVSAHSKLAKRKLEFVQSQEGAVRRTKEISLKLEPLKIRIAQQEAKHKEIQDEIARFKTPPKLDSVKEYFSTADVTDELRRQGVDEKLLTAINGFHKDVNLILTKTKDDAVKLVSIKDQVSSLQLFKQSVEKGKAGLSAQLKDVHLRAVNEELGKLNDLKTAFENSKKSPVELSQTIKAKEEEMNRVEGPLSSLRKEAGDLQGPLDSFDSVLNVTEDKYLAEYIAVQPTVKEIVLEKVEEYKTSLLGRNQFQLLEEIVQRFKKEPGRYPRWLQYMIIHFSGMRYASAHGSWADPKDLYMNLHTSSIEGEIKKMDDDAIESLCLEKVACYEPSSAPAATSVGPARQLPKLAESADKEWKEKIAHHLKGLKSPSLYHQRKALFDLRLDEENYEVESMTSDKALEALESVKDSLPDWMWKEISALTDLRLKEAKDPTWERLTPEEELERNDSQWGRYREIMNKWKQQWVTGWREEHDRANRLVVSRAVCNEVAEHIQHLRGHSPDGGLTAKAPWYQKKEREKKILGSPPPHFIRPFAAQDYTVGASILWLRFVNEEPNPWRIAKPLTTVQGGHGLIPKEYLGKKPAKSGATSNWTYSLGEPIKRTRSRLNEKKQTVRDNQFLRWIHEATVAEVAETAEGPIVLTFETALPYEDRRLSSVGLFKHYLHNIVSDGGEETYNGSFVGYVPEDKANVPVKDLDEMLDWDHVLLKA